MQSPSIQKLIDFFSKFPTVGPRTARRFVFYLLKLPKKEVEGLIFLISEFKNSVKLCRFCFNPFESEEDKSSSSPSESEEDESSSSHSESEEELCQICRDVRRNKSLFCIVANETDLEAIEKTKKYQGLYFILGGAISSPKKENLKKLRIEYLLERVKNPEIKEIIIALNPTTEGETTALYLERTLKPLNKKITRLGRGLPVGGELEYADEKTLSSALEGRK